VIGILVWHACSAMPAYGQRPAPYIAVEIDRFVGGSRVAFPPDYQIILAEDLAREMKKTFKSAEILREGESAPSGKAVLRISGIVIKFQAGSRAKRTLIGLGVGATIVRTWVRFTDLLSGQVLLDRELEGITVMGILDGDSQGAGHQLARKIVSLAKSRRLIERK